MNNYPDFSASQPGGGGPAPSLLIQQGTTESNNLWTRFLNGWYGLTAPAEPINATLAQRELVRHGKLTSMVLFFCLILIVITLPVAAFGSNRVLIPVLSVATLVILGSLQLNRMGKIVLAGSLIVVVMELGFMISLVTTPGGLGAYNLPTLDMLIIPPLIAVSLLPEVSVIAVCLINCIFISCLLGFLPHGKDLLPLWEKYHYNLIVRPVVIQVITGVVTFLWVRSAAKAIARADRAEVIATLEHAIAEQEHAVAQRKRQLDQSIQMMIDTHMRVANGDYNARVPLNDDNVLWQVAGSLNNLLARFQRNRVDSQELKQTKEEIARLTNALRVARQNNSPIYMNRTGTELDMLIIELSLLPNAASSPSRPFSGPLSPSPFEPVRSGIGRHRSPGAPRLEPDYQENHFWSDHNRK